MKTLIIAVFIFLFAFSLRIWNLNAAGRWWDEEWYISKGYTFINLLKKGDLNNPVWYTLGADHPPLAAYIYGLASYGDMVRYDSEYLPFFGWPKGAPVYNYDLVYSRLISVFASSISVVLIYLIGQRYFSRFIGMTSAMILAMVPHFLGFSQMVTLESLTMLSFTSCVYFYLRFLESGRGAFLLLTGILTGACIMVKESNVVIYIFYLVSYLVWRSRIKRMNIPFFHLIYIGIVSMIMSFLIWPEVWLHFSSYFNFISILWLGEGLVPEMLFGRMMGARSFFYIVAFFVTTPVVLLCLSFFGLKETWDRRKKWISLVIIIWFFTPFLLSVFHHRQHMVRYIIQFYAPFSLLAAIGLEKIVSCISKKMMHKYLAAFFVFLYLMYILLNISPYYLNYFNEVVGGTKNVYNRNLFFLGWFGEGLRGPGKYLEDNALKDSKIGMALNPSHTLYKAEGLDFENYISDKEYDYVVVNYFNVIRMGFDESKLLKDYKIVYHEDAGGVDIARVYKKK